MTGCAGSSTWLWAYAAASTALVIVGGLMVGLAYLFVVALTPVLARRESDWACRFLGDVDRAKQDGAIKFVVPFTTCAVLSVATAVLAVVAHLWVSAGGAILFLLAVPLLTLVRLVPLTRTMAELLDAPVIDRAACTVTLRRWGSINAVRFWGGVAGLALVAAGSWLPAMEPTT